MSVCYVTAFMDIGRENWKTFSRSVADYLDHFQPFVDMFRNLDPSVYQMIVFIDETHYDTLRQRIPLDTPIRLVSCSRDYLESNIPTWSYLPIEKMIIQSDTYKGLVGDRIHKFPENYSAEYTVMTTSKVDFVVHAMSFINSDYYCWVDFGYFKLPENIPKHPIDIRKLDLDRINLQILHPLTDSDQNIIYTVRNAPERIAGAFIFGSKSKFLEYQPLYHTIHKEFHTLWLVDDDQHLALQCYYRRPDLFRLHQHYWSRSLIEFQKTNNDDI